jgi:hypothetical protein
MSIDQIECKGTDALLRLEQLRALFSSTRNYPFIIGDREELERLLENLKYDDRPQAAIITESLGIDVLAWFEQRKSEAREDGFVNEEMVGEWSGESQEKESIKSHLDILTGAIKPVVYIGIVNIDEPWMLPAETRYGGWNECPDAALQCAVMHYWKEKYGAEIVSMSGDVIECVVQKPPRTIEDSIELAWEQYWYCSDIVDQGTQTIMNLAAGLMNSDYWFFWWD